MPLAVLPSFCTFLASVVLPSLWDEEDSLDKLWKKTLKAEEQERESKRKYIIN